MTGKGFYGKASPPATPTKAAPSLQYDLFSAFLDNRKGSVSNLIEVWQSIPKYFLTPHQAKQLRTEDGLAQPFRLEYSLRGKGGDIVAFTVKIQPALIEQADGRHKAFFPSTTEELIEEALKKIFANQFNGIHVPEKLQSWVKFSYGMLREELKRCGHSRNYNEIKHALEIMRRCNITVFREGKEIYSGGIISEYIAVDREKYLDDSDSFHYARLPSFISESINTLRYRQFNYERLMSCTLQLTRWLYQRLVSRYTNADLFNSYHFSFSDVQQASGLLMQKNERHNRVKMLESLEELTAKKVLLSYTLQEKKKGRKVADIVYEVRAHPEFIQEQKAANKRQQIALEKARQRGQAHLLSSL